MTDRSTTMKSKLGMRNVFDSIRRIWRATGKFVAVLAVVFAASQISHVQLTSAQESQTATAGPPNLSMESLYHPVDKFDFDGELPSTHWVDDQPGKLLVRRDDSWTVLDLIAGGESNWPMVEQLTEQLTALDGVDEAGAKSAAVDAVSTRKSSSGATLIRIGKSLAITSPQSPARWLTRDATAWRDATLDPTSRRVAYTRDGDLFLLDVEGGKQLQLTNDGTDTLLDGLLDWTYQEEIFGRGNYRAFWFSPNGNWLAMLRIDISDIEPYTLSSSTAERGKGEVSRYPKAGDPIPHASLLVWDLRQADTGIVPAARVIAQSSPQQERIITGVWWNPHIGSLLFCLCDRKQTWRELRSIDDESLRRGEQATRLLLREESPAWVEPPTAPGWLPDGGLIWRSELPTGRTRLYRLSPGGQLVTPLTPENFDVRDFSVSPRGDFLIVTGDANRGTIDQQVYRVALADTSTGPFEMTPLTTEPGWHTPTLSPDGQWFVVEHSTASSPPSLSVRDIDGSTVHVLAKPNLTLKGTRIEPEFLDIPAHDGVPLRAMLVRPPTDGRMLPVVIEVYGGPQTPRVANRWSGTRSLYHELLARRGIATLVVDNRSSAGRGLADTWSIQGRVGEVEFQDLMSAVNWLKGQAWVASDRLALRGWSFGGFLTLYAMTHSDAFRAGIAGGSVTDWREYDAFYTERYMGLPQENEAGYQSTAPLHAADHLSGTVLLIHGESDDNVHPSGTLRMAKALQQAGLEFQLMIYPDAAHAVHQANQLWHLSKMTDRFLVEQLRPGESSNPSAK